MHWVFGFSGARSSHGQLLKMGKTIIKVRKRKSEEGKNKNKTAWIFVEQALTVTNTLPSSTIIMAITCFRRKYIWVWTGWLDKIMQMSVWALVKWSTTIMLGWILALVWCKKYYISVGYAAYIVIFVSDQLLMQSLDMLWKYWSNCIILFHHE